MDERITFVGVQKILHPTRPAEKENFSNDDFWDRVYLKINSKYPLYLYDESEKIQFIKQLKNFYSFNIFFNQIPPTHFSSFLWAISDGGDQRYGRILWNSIALIGYYPEKLWGERGQIISGRMLQVFLIIISVLIISFGILRNWPTRIVLIGSILTLPYVDYYMTMPKPEPLQLFFLTLFIYQFYKKEMSGGWHWIFMGLAFGTKISALPALILFIIFSLFYKNNKHKNFKASLEVSILSFMTGLVIAVPILLGSTLFFLFGYFLLKKIQLKFKTNLVFKIIYLTLLVTLTGLIFIKPLIMWVGSTFLNTSHGSDQSNINFLSWARYFIFDLFGGPPLLNIIFVLLILYILIMNIYIILKKDYINFDRNILAIAIIFAGIAELLSIFIGTHRLWGFYLFPGMVLVIIGTLFLVDLSLNLSVKLNLKSKVDLFSKFISYLLLFTSAFFSLFFWAPERIKNLSLLEKRTSTVKYFNEMDSYLESLKFLQMTSFNHNQALKVAFDPFSFIPNSTSKYKIILFNGEDIYLSHHPDVIVFGPGRGFDNQINNSLHLTQTEYNLFRRGYIDHVQSDDHPCTVKPCYKKAISLSNGGQILILIGR